MLGYNLTYTAAGKGIGCPIVADNHRPFRHGGACADTTAKTGTLQGQGDVPKPGPLPEPRVFAVSVLAQHQ